MASLVEIANSALDLIGQAQIMTLDDPTASARKAKLHIYDAIREVLASGRWTSAQKLSALSQLASGPAFGWTYAYQLPGDYLGVITFNDVDPCNVVQELFEIRGRELHTDETTANIVYVADLTATGNDIGAATPMLAECFAVKLATKLAWSFQQSATLRQAMLQEYEYKRKAALARDAREYRRPLVSQLSDSSWIRRRHNSTNG
jgi:hypothetical protein